MNILSNDASGLPQVWNLRQPRFADLNILRGIGWTRDPLPMAPEATSHLKPDSCVPSAACAALPEVLVVDDNHDAADSLAQLVGVMGAKASVAYGAQEALTAMTTTRPKIAIIDISMPLMNGYELAAQIRARASFEGVMLIALTGWTQSCEQQDAADSGFDHHLTKPADVQQLSRLLDSIAP